MSTAATLTVSTLSEAPQVTANPVDKGVVAGEDAVFEAAASGLPTPTVQWQLSRWRRVVGRSAGATSDTLTVEHTTVSESGYQYRPYLRTKSRFVTSTAATLTVKEEEHKVENQKKKEKRKRTRSRKTQRSKIRRTDRVADRVQRNRWGGPKIVGVSPAGGSSSASGGGVLGGHAQASSPAPDAELASTTLTTKPGRRESCSPSPARPARAAARAR